MGFTVKTERTRVSLLYFVLLLSTVYLSRASSIIESCKELEASSSEGDDGCCTCKDVCPSGFFKLKLPPHNSTFMCEATRITNGTVANSTQPCSVEFTCGRCAEQCAVCNGTGPESCTVCEDVSFNGSCLSDCPQCHIPQKLGPKVPAIAGGTAGGLVAVVVLIVLIVCLCRKKKGSSDQEISRQAIPKNDTELGEHGLGEHGPGEVHQNDKELTLETQIHQGHDAVLRYTQDPTENIPQRQVAVVDDRQSAMYENFHHANLIQQISKDDRVLVSQSSQSTDGSDTQDYENLEPKKTRSNTNELKEIEHLPLAPLPPKADLKAAKGTPSLLKGPGYIDDNDDSWQNQTKDHNGEVNAKSDNQSGSSQTAHNKLSLMKGPKYSRSKPVGGACKSQSALRRGPAYNPDADTYDGKGIGQRMETDPVGFDEDYSEMTGLQTNDQTGQDTDAEDYINTPKDTTPSGSKVKPDPLYDNIVPRNGRVDTNH